jgi:DNA-directed RNA polymerase specialized sigma subunit
MKHRRNTIDEIDLLVKYMRSKDAAKRDAAVAGLCVAFEPLIRSLIPKYMQPVSGSESEDLEQVARLGLLEACKTFTRSKGAFPTHATWCIRHALSLYVAGLGNPVRLPTKQSLRISKLRRTALALAQQLERQPTVEELSQAINLPKEAVLTMLGYIRGPALDGFVEHFPSDCPSPEALLIAHEEVTNQRSRA